MRRIARVSVKMGQVNRLDYVACLVHQSAGSYVRVGTAQSGLAFVATNSITQGEQCRRQLWPILFDRCGLDRSAFAHRTFAVGLVTPAGLGPRCIVVIIGLDRARTSDGKTSACSMLFRHQRAKRRKLRHADVVALSMAT